MKVYIASQYKKKAAINQKIYYSLLEGNIDAFLPENINVDAVAEKPEEQRHVALICYNELKKCDVILCVWEFGKSVSAELGFAIQSKLESDESKKLILFDTKDEDINLIKNEAMIWPFFDQKVDSIDELIHYLKSIS